MSSSQQLHFVLIPLLAQGHMIPMIDMAKLLAQHGGVTASLVTTPHNTSRFSSTIHRARISGLDIRLIEIPFPCHQVGLPPGCENLDSVPSRDLIRNFYAALDMLQQPLEQHLLLHNSPPPSCIISDKYLPWTSQTAARFKIPRIVFHGMCCFSLLSSHNVKLHRPHLSAATNSDQAFTIPGMPVEVSIKKSQLPGEFVALPDLDDIRGQMQEAESNAYGVVVNTFPELEGGCVREYQKAIDKKLWCIGPVSLCNREPLDMFERGNHASIDPKNLNWLNSMKSKSVLYACLGSQCRLIPAQLIQLGLGLESSNHPFIWVIKTGGDRFEELERWLEDEQFENRVRGRGMIIKGWAPQVLILSHRAIGGFLTHCGWNSTIEGVCAGVPLITWPMFAEQFLNEKLVVEVLKVGVRVGVEVPVRWGEEENVGVVVRKEQVRRAVEAVMMEEGEERRRRAGELRTVAMSKMKIGGSACDDNISDLITDIRRKMSKK